MPSPSRPTKAPVVFVVVGSILSLGVVWGVIGTVIGMVRAFHTMGGDGVNVDNADALASDIGLTTMSTAIGLLMTPVGVVLLAIGIPWMIRQRKANED